MKIAIGGDHASFDLKEPIFEHLTAQGYDVTDLGVERGGKIDYPVIAEKIANAVAAGEYDFGIVICGTGIGVSIAANKVKGIRCAALSDTYTARLTREHNDSNMMALGARVIGPELAKDIVDMFIKTPGPHEERHMRRVNLITEIENR